MAVKYRGRTQKMWMQTPTGMNDCLSNLEAISLYSLPYTILISSFLTCNEWFKFHEIVGRIKGEEVHEVETPLHGQLPSLFLLHLHESEQADGL